MDQRIWGPHVWFILHTIAHNYPEQPEPWRKKATLEFLYNLKYMLPCKYYRAHYTQHIKNYPPDQHLKNRQSLIEYLVFLHNLVNRQNGLKENRPYKILTSEFVTQNYELIYNKNPFTSNDYLIFILLILAIFIIFIKKI